MRKLKDREGELVIALIPIIDKTVMQRVRLHLVEESGIWIESQKLIDASLGAMKVTSAPKTAIFFLPWHQIFWIVDSIDVPAFAEEAAEL